ncbi:autophagy-related protein 8B isoform X2 [Tupanvirus soda lake]|uniref:Autophagy-related protein 8B isoform X2 n=2 Tax=Tupanvirus TaxID=2094720 RepID=A0A6N1NQ65_9VIRU|nr:autophagy-related protein 8B isoform X2 [Tupanvirus soda lake]QKU35930.1 autophagy-related protein 8B isoform X2 [Tupanvirus soda lake]
MNKNKLTLGEKCIQMYPNKIPIILHLKNINITNFNNKFLVADDITMSYVLVIIRRKIKIAHNESLCMFIKDNLVVSSELVSTFYSKYKDQNDGCLHITVCKENTFGK